MAYSRWGSSYFYTYWNSEDGRDDSTFEVCAVLSVTAKEIRDNIDDCVARILAANEENGKSGEFRPPTPSDIAELRECMLEFLQDVDAFYPINPSGG